MCRNPALQHISSFILTSIGRPCFATVSFLGLEICIVQIKDSHQIFKKSKLMLHLNIQPLCAAQWFILVSFKGSKPFFFFLAQSEHLVALLFQNHFTFNLFFFWNFLLTAGNKVAKKVLVILPGKQFQYPSIIHFEVAWTSVTTARACKRKCCGENWAPFFFSFFFFAFQVLVARLVPRERCSKNTHSGAWCDLPPYLQRSHPCAETVHIPKS